MEWISVDSGTPEDGQLVLYATSDGSVSLGAYSHNDWYYYDPYSYDPVKTEWGKVTHWIPLPSPPIE
jgi:hypothetical protein